jgi:tRNA-binding protein
MEITYKDFEKVEVRVGKIIEATQFKEAIKAAYKLVIDFGEFGIKCSSAQITQNYSTSELVGKEVVAVVNFPPKQIANFISHVLVLGFNDANGNVVLLVPDKDVPLGNKMY